MAGASDALMAVMSGIVDKAQELAKNKISKLPIAANQPTGPPTIINPLVRPAGQSSTDDKPTKKRTQQYAEWDTREYTSSKDGRQKWVDTREEQRAKLQMQSVKRDMLVYKQMVCELKTVLETEKDKKVQKALVMEIHANEDIIKMMIRSGISDVPLPPEIELQITVDKNKSGNLQPGLKSPRTQSQAVTESDKDGKKSGEGGTQPRRKGASSSGKPGELPEEVEPEDDRAKNCGNRPKRKGTEPKEANPEGDKVKNLNKHSKGKAAEPKGEDDTINHKNLSEGGRSARKGRKGSDKANNRKEPSADMLDLFTLPDFLDNDDDNNDDYEPPVRKRRKRKAVPLIEDDDDDEKEEGDGDEDDGEDKDYEEDDEEGEDDEENEDKEDDNKEITLQAGKADERKRKKPVAKGKSTDTDIVIEERPKAVGQRCANVDQATEFRKYIRDAMKTFEGHVKKGQQVKKYLLEMIEDVWEACMNIGIQEWISIQRR